MENELVRLRFGSHLYGTSTELSDTDYKGVYLVPINDVLLGKIPKSKSNNTKSGNNKNTADDVDIEIYSLHYFIKLACEGQTVALDMLHAPLDFVDHYTDEWKFIVDNREKFYTKNLKAFVGYARKQAAKYGVKGSRLNVMKDMVKLLSSCNPKAKLFDIWDSLPLGEHSRYVEDSPNNVPQYEICGRILQSTGTIAYNLDVVNKFYNNYGERAKQAAENKGIDWKAISHALRAAYQVRELLAHKTITFPRPEAAALLRAKQGQMDYLDEAEPLLNSVIAEVEELALKSDLPEKADKKFWDEFIVDIYTSKETT